MKRTLEVMEYYRKLKSGELFEFEEKGFEEDEDFKEAPKKPKVKKEYKKKKPKSLKKIVAAMDLKVKEGVLPQGAVSTGESKKNKKKTEE